MFSFISRVKFWVRENLFGSVVNVSWGKILCWGQNFEYQADSHHRGQLWEQVGNDLQDVVACRTCWTSFFLGQYYK